MKKSVTVLDILGRKGKQPIVMVTSYDATMTRIVDDADIDIILVGDSAGMVMAGLDNTLGATMDMMLLFVRSVTNANSIQACDQRI